MEKAKQYYLMVEDKKVYVTEEVYKAYWQETNRERYLNKLEERYTVNFSAYKRHQTERDIQEVLGDNKMDLEHLIEFKESIEALHTAIDRLTPEEKELIRVLFFENKSETNLGDRLGVSKQAINKRKRKILGILKNFLEEK